MGKQDEKFEKAVIDAAISFARDHGPISAAVNGDESARLAVGGKFARILISHGLRVELN